MIFVFLGLVAGFGGLLAIVSHFLISTFLISSPCNKLVVSFSGESSDSDYGESGERESQNVFFSSVQSKSWNQCLHPIKRPNLEIFCAHIYPWYFSTLEGEKGKTAGAPTGLGPDKEIAPALWLLPSPRSIHATGICQIPFFVKVVSANSNTGAYSFTPTESGTMFWINVDGMGCSTVLL